MEQVLEQKNVKATHVKLRLNCTFFTLQQRVQEELFVELPREKSTL